MRIESTDDDAVAGLLDAAELWLAAPSAEAQPMAGGRPLLIAGWEDAHPYCAAVCSTDVGLAFCRSCPVPLVERVAARRRPASTCCPAGVRLLAFAIPSPDAREAEDTAAVAVLRVAPPDRTTAGRIGSTVKVSAARLRRAATLASGTAAQPRSVRRAVATLRDPRSRSRWQAQRRAAAADRRRSSVAALAQMAATAEELADLYRIARLERAELERSRRRVDRLAREAVRAKDHEGALIAHRIHDTAAQSMVSAFRFLDAARASAAADPSRPEVDRQLGEASERLLAAIREVRGVLQQVLPPAPDELGVGPAIRARHRFLLSEATAGAGGDGHRLEGHVTGQLPRLVEWVEQALSSIVGEAIANAVRHSGASRIDVTLAEQRGRAVITVEDDGRGLPSKAAHQADGHGLGIVGMTRQTSWLGGRIAIGPRGDGGTRVRISIPLVRHRRPVHEAAGAKPGR